MKNIRIISACVATALLTLIPSTDAAARSPRGPWASRVAYGYGHSIDLQLGIATSPYSVAGASKKATGLADGGDFSLRYTYFPSRNVGFYVQGEVAGSSSDDERFFRVVNRADGNMYKYDLEHYCSGWHDSYSETVSSITAGAAFRYDFGQWSLRPRVGLGFGEYDFNGYSYTRYDRNNASAAPTYHHTYAIAQAHEYLVNQNDNYLGVRGVFVGEASLQLMYTLNSHFYFSAELAAKAMPVRAEIITESYKMKNAYEPETWVEAVYNSDLQNNYAVDYSSKTTSSYDMTFNGIFSAKLGIGWNIGWNRNESNWYSRRR